MMDLIKLQDALQDVGECGQSPQLFSSENIGIFFGLEKGNKIKTVP